MNSRFSITPLHHKFSLSVSMCKYIYASVSLPVYLSICNEHLKKRSIPIFLGFEGIVPVILLIRKE